MVKRDTHLRANRKRSTVQNRRIALAATVATLALGLTACGSKESGSAEASGNDTQTTAASSSAAPPEAPASSAAEETAANKATPGEITPPGTELKVGETATVPFTYGTDMSGTIAITVTDIEKGSSSDLAQFGDRAKGLVPYYIKFTVENVEGTDLSYSSVRLRANTADGRGTGVIISGDVEGKCESETAGRDFTTAGATFETCALQASQEGVDVVSAEFNEGDDYQDDPISWTK
ncbi:hypothetical protein SacazDRAFT_02536 [Saccharomonospora azurea NA-128]|uniref:Uncharacterized protein n=1 Tax=Saccharomonospora azurea NA-128 TaxID=882081 RepID=H8G880_9PSEU|nr:hypothetical protein SacazDRAFT_02536 [Saccharomonospora azurea NA-128]